MGGSCDNTIRKWDENEEYKAKKISVLQELNALENAINTTDMNDLMTQLGQLDLGIVSTDIEVCRQKEEIATKCNMLLETLERLLLDRLKSPDLTQENTSFPSYPPQALQLYDVEQNEYTLEFPFEKTNQDYVRIALNVLRLLFEKLIEDMIETECIPSHPIKDTTRLDAYQLLKLFHNVGWFQKKKEEYFIFLAEFNGEDDGEQYAQQLNSKIETIFNRRNGAFHQTDGQVQSGNDLQIRFFKTLIEFSEQIGDLVNEFTIFFRNLTQLYEWHQSNKEHRSTSNENNEICITTTFFDLENREYGRRFEHISFMILLNVIRSCERKRQMNNPIPEEDTHLRFLVQLFRKGYAFSHTVDSSINLEIDKMYMSLLAQQKRKYKKKETTKQTIRILIEGHLNRIAKFRTKNSHSTSFVDTISNVEILDLADATIELAKETCLDKYEAMSVQLKEQFKRHRQINQEITPVEDHVFYEEDEFDLENEGPDEETTSTTTSTNNACNIQSGNEDY